MMAEEKTKKKKPVIIKRILKWIGLGLLVLLLIASLIFQAPWKVTILLLIILAACTVLPKPYRKWFWLSVAAVVVVLIIWVFLPDDNEGWRPYTFDEELAALEVKYAIPEDENAATIYDELLKGYDGERFVFPDLSSVGAGDANIIEYMELFKKAKPKNTFYPDFWDEELEDLTISKPWSSKEYPELVKWLKEKHESTIEKLIQASLKRLCQFPINVDMVNAQHIDRYMAMVDWVHLLIRAANNDRGDGRIDQAVEKYTSVLKMNNLILQDSSDATMGIGISLRIMKPLKRFVISGEITNEHLNILEEALKGIKYDWTWNFPRIIEYEKLKMKNIIALAYEVNPQGRTRLSRDTSANPLQVQFNIDRPQTCIRKKFAKAGTILGWFFVPSTPQKAAKIVDTAFKPLYEMAEPDFDWEKEPEELSLSSIRFNFGFLAKLIVGMSEETYYRIHDIYLRNIAEQRGARVIISLRRYKNKTGKWPEKLDDIKPAAPPEIFIDPINGDSFVYKLTEENFALYSKGKNNIDEGGKYKRRYGETSEGDDWLIWPSGGQKTEESQSGTEKSDTLEDVIK
jgi:hypothetical protein